MSEQLLTCPQCGGDQVTVTEETQWMVNTMEHFCHSVKAHDSDAKVACLKCSWDGSRRDLTAESSAAADRSERGV